MREPVINIEEQSQLINPNLLPPVLRELVKVLGLGVALDLVQKLGGTYCYVPHTIKPGHQLEVAIGIDAATKLSAVYKGEELQLPKADKALIQLKHAVVQLMISRGENNTAIAIELGYTVRRVEQLRDEMNIQKPTNIDLFTEDKHAN